MGEISRKTFGTIFNWRNMVQVGLPIAGVLALTVTGYYGTKFLWTYIQHKTINPKPKVLLPGAKVGWYDRWKRYWARYKTPAMIFTEAIKARLHEIVEKTQHIKKHIKAGKKATYDNLLLYGEPGTGKTLFATILADLTDMDFAATTAGALLQQGAGVKYLNELIEMAERSRYGVILFIDEADALFVDRTLLDPASEHYQVLNHLLALTGDGSSKFMLIAATNHAYVMDEAMGRRFQDRVHMPLPDAATRKSIIELYVETVLYNTKNNGEDFVKEIKKLLTKTVIQNLVEKTEGLSNAEIKDIIGAIYKKSLATQSGLPTLTIITSALEEGLEKKRALLEDRAQREAHAVTA
jgi:SpoVK/Ycf46/Vps4 family AAA+-type ATPase